MLRRVDLIGPTKDPEGIDTLPTRSKFVAISPDRKWIAYTQGVTGVSMQRGRGVMVGCPLCST